MSKTFPRPLCTNPTLLVNRNAVMLWLNGAVLHRPKFEKDMEQGCPTYDIYNFPWRHYCALGYRLISRVDGKRVWDDKSIDLLSRYYVEDSCGHFEYLYTLVKCGHCELCNHSRLVDFKHRVIWESQTSVNRPIMVNLTYDNDHIPLDEEGLQRGVSSVPERRFCSLCKSDVQKFLKRLRINWDRSNDPEINHDNKLRYVLVGEYGTKSGHPHYHAIFWNYPYALTQENDFRLLNKLKDDIFRAWNMGDYEHSVKIAIARDAGGYVGKYISKTFSNGRKGIVLKSNRNGGIGARFLDMKATLFHENPCLQTLDFVCKWSGKSFSHSLGIYGTNRIFPPFRTFTSRFRDLFLQGFNRLVTRANRVFTESLLEMPALWDIFRTKCDKMFLDYYSAHMPTDFNIYWRFPFRGLASYRFNRIYVDYADEFLFHDKKTHEIFDMSDDDLSSLIKTELSKIDPHRIRHLADLRDRHLSSISRINATDSYIFHISRHYERQRLAAQEREIF